jgi:hypothetical protein
MMVFRPLPMAKSITSGPGDAFAASMASRRLHKASVQAPSAESAFVVTGNTTGSGVTALEDADGLLVPITLVAVTVNVYVVPFVRPSNVALVASAGAVAVMPPGEEVTVYVVAGLPLLNPGVQETTACRLWAVAPTFVGGSGREASSKALSWLSLIDPTYRTPLAMVGDDSSMLPPVAPVHSGEQVFGVPEQFVVPEASKP